MLYKYPFDLIISIKNKPMMHFVVRTGYLICGAQNKMKMHDSLLTNYEEFQDGGRRTLYQVGGPCKHRKLCAGVHQGIWPCPGGGNGGAINKTERSDSLQSNFFLFLFFLTS